MKSPGQHYNDYRFSFILAVLIHILLISMVFISFIFSKEIQPAGSGKPIIQAVVVNSQAIAEAAARLKAEALQREQQAALERQQKLAQQAEAAKQARIQEQQHLAQVQAEKIKAEQQQAAAKAAALKAAQLKQQQIAEQQHQAQLQKQAAAAAAIKQQQIAKQQALQKQQAVQKQQALQQQAIAKKAADKKAKQLALAARKKQLHDQLTRQLTQQLDAEQQQIAADRDKQTDNIVEQYFGMIKDAVENSWNKPDTADPNAKCVLLIHLAPDGSVISVSIAKSSGDPALDQSAMTAVYKAQPLPVPTDADIFDKNFRNFQIKA